MGEVAWQDLALEAPQGDGGHKGLCEGARGWVRGYQEVADGVVHGGLWGRGWLGGIVGPDKPCPDARAPQYRGLNWCIPLLMP